MKTKCLLKKNLQSCFLVLGLFFCVISYGQKKVANNFSNGYIDNCIREVFQNKANELVFRSDSHRYELIKDFFNRFSIIYQPNVNDNNDYKKFSSLILNNRFNSGLKRDKIFNPNTFNPLKYKINLASEERRVCHVDGTDYILVIQPFTELTKK